MPAPFILLDDARPSGAGAARLYRDPAVVVVAHRPGDVEPALQRIAELSREGYALAGYLAYEAGLALEPRLLPLAEARCGADGPLLWFGAFAGYETIASRDVPQWLAARATTAQAAIGPLEPQLSPAGHAAAFAALQEAIRAGDIYQANLSFPLAGSWRGDPLALYAALRPAACAGHGGIVHDGSHWLLSFSPELFFALEDGEATVKPMKGTRPRGATAAEDAALAAELAQSAKDRAENLMIVDLLRNDLGRVCMIGSVEVDGLFTVESFATVHQLVSTIRGQLVPSCDAVQAVRAAFPPGSMTGAPKLRTMEIIDGLEGGARGPYSGALGWFSVDGAADLAVVIRSVVVAGGHATVGAGGAVVELSSPAAELDEMLLKAAVTEPALREAACAAPVAAAVS